MARGNGPTLAQRLPLLMLNVLLVLSNATSRAKSFWGMRKKEKRCRRRAKAQTEKPSAEQSQPQAPCKQPPPHGSPEKTPSPSSASSPPTERGMKEPVPTLETCASAEAPSMEDLWRLLPGMVYSLSFSSMSSSDSLHSLFCVPPREHLYPPHRIHSSRSGSISSEDSFYIPERGLAAMAELVAQECSGPAQSPEDDQGLVATAGGDETLPKERPHSPTCREVEAKLRQPGGEMGLNAQRVELPRGLLDTAKAVDGGQDQQEQRGTGQESQLWRCLSRPAGNGAYDPAAAAAASPSPQGDNAGPRGATGTPETADGGVGLGTSLG